jgi:Tfp pilus assembly protein PilN
MFEINLIRNRIIPGKQKNMIFGLISLYLLIWILSLAAVLFLWVANVRMIEIYKGKLTRLEREISATYPGLPTVEELTIMGDKLFSELTGINNLLRKRILWAPKLNQISSSVPKGVWIDELRSGQGASGEIVSRKKGKNKSGSTKSRQQSLIIEGKVLSASDKKGIKAIESFVSSLKTNALFMEGIESVELVATEKTTTGARSIRAFQVRCRFSNRKGL